MTEPFKTEALAGWGRFNPAPCRVYRPERMDGLMALLDGGSPAPMLARGLGRSYGDTSVNQAGAVLDMTRLNRMRSFDPETGVLDCEAGVSLTEILEIFAPRGWRPPVVPGTRFITVGGAIANDVHGKSHHRDGSFSAFLIDITLWTPAGGVITCSASERPEVFWATVGGIGLTGVILSVRLQLRRVESGYVTVDYLRCPNLDAALDAMDHSDQDYHYSVGWVDCLAKDASLGRTVLMRGNTTAPGQLPRELAQCPHHIPRRRNWSIPVDFPGLVLNPFAIKAFNELFYKLHPPLSGKREDCEKFFFPLDGIHHWNRMYGRRGFVQYQATFPLESRDGLRTLLQRCSLSRRASFLAVLKRFGAAGQGLMSHPMPGYTITLDIPNAPDLIPFLRELDQILLDHGARLYLAKDACTTPETISRMYPNVEAFKEVCRGLDPEGRLGSDMGRRLGLCGATKEEATHE